MAGHWRYALNLVTPTAVAAASTANPEHPATNVLTITRPRRTYWTDDDADGKTIDLDLGVATVVTQVLVENTNAGQMQFQGSANLSSFTTVLAPTAVPFDAQVKRGRGLLTLTGFNHRYLRVILSSVRAPTPGHFSLGAITLLGTVTTAAVYYGAPFEGEVSEPLTILPYLGDGAEVNREGERSHRIGPLIGGFNGHWPKIARPDLDALDALGLGVPFVFDRNDDDPTHAYLVWITAPIVIRDFGGGFGFEAPVQLKEYI